MAVDSLPPAGLPKTPWYRRTRWILLILLILPYFAAPMVWRFKPTWPKALRYVVYAYGAVVGLFVLAGMVAPKPATQTVQATPAPTVAAPTATVQVAAVIPPTAAPTKPPAPTSTPQPTSTMPPATPAVAPEIVSYLGYMQPRMATISSALKTLSEQSALVQPNPAIITTSAWKLKTGVALGFMQAAGEEIQKYEPVPKGAETLDKMMVELGKDLIYVSTEYAAGIDNINAARINNAVVRMGAVNQKLPLAVAQVKLLTGQ